jgi:hypothetical protein
MWFPLFDRRWPGGRGNATGRRRIAVAGQGEGPAGKCRRAQPALPHFAKSAYSRGRAPRYDRLAEAAKPATAEPQAATTDPPTASGEPEFDVAVPMQNGMPANQWSRGSGRNPLAAGAGHLLQFLARRHVPTRPAGASQGGAAQPVQHARETHRGWCGRIVNGQRLLSTGAMVGMPRRRRDWRIARGARDAGARGPATADPRARQLNTIAWRCVTARRNSATSNNFEVAWSLDGRGPVGFTADGQTTISLVWSK